MLKSPAIDHYLEWLGRISYREVGNIFTYDVKSYQLITEIIELTSKIKPYNENTGARELWLTSDRGEFSDYIDDDEYDERIQEFDETDESMHKEWLDFYPEATQWYHFVAMKDEATGYIALFLNHRHIIEVDPTKEAGFEHDVHAFLEWILDAVKQALQQLKDGTYIDYLNANLPYEHRTGTIVRKDFYDIFPEDRKVFENELTESQINEFKQYIQEPPRSPLATMTANQFYDVCSLGYRENEYECNDLNNKELYYRFADSRDAGLITIDGDSATEFDTWYMNLRLGRTSGHPWEVCRGGNSTHIDLYVNKTKENTWNFIVCGKSIGRYIEAIKFYIAIYRKGYPVTINDKEELLARIDETEKIGIVPTGVFPRYCEGYFPEETVIDFMNLPYEHKDEIIAKTNWHPIRTIELMA